MSTEIAYITKCKTLIEQKLNWGLSDSWQKQDFEQLSEQIYKETNVSLSVSTLKRIWGKVRYESSPNLATLNALAKFIGYTNWREFIAKGQIHKSELIEEISNDITKPSSNRKSKISFIGLLVLFAIIVCLCFIRKKKTSLHFENVKFSSQPVTKGMPNTVVFNYDASSSNADSVFIQQNWNAMFRFKVDKNKREYTSTYYQPGYFKAKLILNDSIIKEHDLFLQSEGWLGMIEKNPIPIYFSKTQIHKKETIGVNLADLASVKSDLYKGLHWVSLFNVDSSKIVMAENLNFEADVKNTFSTGDGVCQKTYIVLLCTEGIIAFPLSIKGCVGEMSLIIGMQEISGKSNNLSSFGINDFNDFVHVKAICMNRSLKIFINGNIAFESEIKNSLGKVVGTQVRFFGSGEIKGLKLQKLQ